MGESLDLGILELNSMAKSVGHVTIDFFALSMHEVYAIQKVTVIYRNESKRRRTSQASQSIKQDCSLDEENN